MAYVVSWAFVDDTKPCHSLPGFNDAFVEKKNTVSLVWWNYVSLRSYLRKARKVSRASVLGTVLSLPWAVGLIWLIPCTVEVASLPTTIISLPPHCLNRWSHTTLAATRERRGKRKKGESFLSLIFICVLSACGTRSGEPKWQMKLTFAGQVWRRRLGLSGPTILQGTLPRLPWARYRELPDTARNRLGISVRE